MDKSFQKITKLTKWILLLAAYIAVVFIFVKHSEHAKNEYLFDDENIEEWNDNWEIHFGNSTVDGINLPAQLPVERGETVILRNVLPDKLKNYNCLMFEGKRQDIDVSINGIQRASFSNKDNRPWGKTTPSGVVLVPLYNTDGRADVAIRVTSDSTYTGKIGGVYIGNEKSLVLMMIKKNSPSFFFTIIIFILGIICVVSFYTYSTSFEISRAMEYLAFFAFLSAIWSFSQSGLRQLFLDDLAILEDVGYIAYMLLPIPYIIYTNLIVGGKYKKFSDFYVVLATVNFVLENLMMAIFGWGFYEMRHATQLVLLIGIGGAIYIGIIERQKKKNALLVRYSIAGTIGLVLGLLSEIASQNLYFVGNSLAISNTIYIIGAAIFLFSGFLYTLRCVSDEQKIRKDAESANKAKTNFLATMSHEIKTPINAMIGMNEMIIRESSEDAIREYAISAEDAGKALLVLVDDVLDFSKIESGKMEIVSANYQMKSLLQDLISMVSNKLKAKDSISFILDVDEELPSVFFGDSIRIKQVLSNLLSNAIKYTDQGSITFGVTCQQVNEDEMKLFFAVKDTGRGIKEEDFEKIMESFKRSEEEVNSNIAGAGLGLTITKQLLELMGSELEFESDLGKGSDFHFVLKQRVVDYAPVGLVKLKPKTDKTKHKITFTAPGAKVLAVDDTAMNLKVLSHLLKPTNIQLDTCDGGKKSLELCKDNKYDLIFMDHMMPEMDGIEAYKNIRQDKSLASTDSNIVVLTANTVSGAEEMYRGVGFDYYMKKPVDVVELNEVLLRFLPPEKIKPMVIE